MVKVECLLMENEWTSDLEVDLDKYPTRVGTFLARLLLGVEYFEVSTSSLLSIKRWGRGFRQAAWGGRGLENGYIGY